MKQFQKLYRLKNVDICSYFKIHCELHFLNVLQHRVHFTPVRTLYRIKTLSTVSLYLYDIRVVIMGNNRYSEIHRMDGLYKAYYPTLLNVNIT